MKEKNAVQPEVLALAETSLYEAVISLADPQECRAFFHDLCTPAELQALIDRWAVVMLLREGLTYREIHSRTGVSVTTVGRVARYLADGYGGYRAVAERMHS